MWNRSFQQRRGHCPPSIIPRLVNVAEVHVRAQSHEGSLRGNLRGRSLPSSLRPMLVIFCGNKPFSSSGHLNRWAGSWASRALVRLFRMLEDSSACSWRGQQCISPDSAFGPPERGTSLDSQFNSDFVSNFDTPQCGGLHAFTCRCQSTLSNSSIPSHGSLKLPLGGEATGEEGVIPVPGTSGASRGGLNACRRGAWNRTPAPGG